MKRLFDEFKNSGKIEEALLIGRNMLNKEPGNYDWLKLFLDYVLFLAEKMQNVEIQRHYLNQAGLTLSFFEENADLTKEMIDNITSYRTKINDLQVSISKMENRQIELKIIAIVEKNGEMINELYRLNQKVEKTKKQAEFDSLLKDISNIDSEIQQDYLTEEQKNYYEDLNRKCTDSISNKMRELEYKRNVTYNKEAVTAFESAFKKFKNDESKYQDQTQLFALVSSTLFAYDASKLFNETMIYYNHIYSYIFSKLTEDGKLALTRFSIECERKQR